MIIVEICRSSQPLVVCKDLMPDYKIYIIRIFLNSNPSIWRKMKISGNKNFLELHTAIQDTMGWQDKHLHEFRVTNPLSGKIECIGVPDDENGWDTEIVSGENRLISEILTIENSKATYIYDFGDYWVHSLIVENIAEVKDDSFILQCLSGEKACPPEDCGGVDGYTRIIDCYETPQYHETNDEYFKSLIEEGFHPNIFVPSNVNYRTSSEFAVDAWSVSEQELWLRKLLQGKIVLEELKQEFGAKIKVSDIEQLRNTILKKPLRFRNRAVGVFASLKGIHPEVVEGHLFISFGSIKSNYNKFLQNGIPSVISDKRKTIKKHEEIKYIDKVFEIIHSPPSSYGFNRTTWKQADILKVMSDEGFKTSNSGLRFIIKNSGYNYRKAKTVLTSNDPQYREKIDNIKSILSNLGADEKFFSIDEYGPFGIKMQGGLSLVPKGTKKTIPQWQKSKGSLIITAALELSTNQITHFYSQHKNTDEMMKLLNILIEKYANQKTIYLSWDAASWHASKKLQERVDDINSNVFQEKLQSPLVKLAPLPTCAQFLNVIESVFSGMARAIIHNSDYDSLEECQAAVDRYFLERNGHFLQNPKHAGNKIWGKERVIPSFDESKNCKDPMYR